MMLCCAILLVVALAGPAVAEPPASAKDSNDSNSSGTNTLWYFEGSSESQNTCDETTWAFAVSKKARVRDCVDLAVDLTRRTGSYVVGNFSGARGGDYAPVAKRGTCTLGLKRLENDDKATGIFTVGDSDVVEIVKDAVSRLGNAQMVSGVGTMLCDYEGDDADRERFMMWRLWDAGSG